MKIEGRLLLFDVENADGSRISPDCKIDIPEIVPIIKDFEMGDPNSCIGSASVSIDDRGLVFTGDIPDDFDTDEYPGCGGYYTGVTYIDRTRTVVTMCLKCVGLVKKAVHSAYKYKKTKIFCPICGIIEDKPKFMQTHCIYCGHELIEEEKYTKGDKNG